MIKTMIVTCSIATMTIFSAANNFITDLPKPVQISEDAVRTKARLALIELNAPAEHRERLISAVHSAAVATGIDPILIACIIPKESEFKISARSPKNYKGLMQADKATMKWGFAETDVVYGACILREKIQIAHGDVEKGMVFYKGHGGKESQDIARAQMKFYRGIRDRVEAKITESNKLTKEKIRG
jgi:hypothetical protein